MNTALAIIVISVLLSLIGVLIGIEFTPRNMIWGIMHIMAGIILGWIAFGP